MIDKENRGIFITFEGGEGVGKSTQLKMLDKRLQSHGIKTTLTREPGGTTGGEIIRYLLKSGAAKPLGPFAETVLIASARDEHLEQIIRPALKSQNWVLCDRFIDSTRAYQGAGAGVDERLLNSLERSIVGDTLPDLTIVLDSQPETGLARAKLRDKDNPDRFEKERLSFHHRLRSSFLSIAAKNPERCVVIKTEGSVEQIAQDVWDVVEERFSQKLAKTQNSDSMDDIFV